jgi:hypothetical protein
MHYGTCLEHPGIFEYDIRVRLNLAREMLRWTPFQVLGLKGNPLGTDVLSLFSEVNGTR